MIELTDRIGITPYQKTYQWTIYHIHIPLIFEKNSLSLSRLFLHLHKKDPTQHHACLTTLRIVDKINTAQTEDHHIPIQWNKKNMRIFHKDTLEFIGQLCLHESQTHHEKFEFYRHLSLITPNLLETKLKQTHKYTLFFGKSLQKEHS